MKTIVLNITIIIFAIFPKIGIADPASINNNVSVTDYVQVPFAGVNGFNAPEYSMNNFINNEEYKIIIIKDDPQTANNVQMSVGGFTVTSDDKFEYKSGRNFRITYSLTNSTPIGQTQLIKFQIYRKRLLGIWDWETTFFYYLTTICTQNYNFNSGIVSQGNYEVSSNIEVSSNVQPTIGVTKFDAGSSVSFLPGFSSTIVVNSSILAIIDGCGGAFRVSNPVINNLNSSEAVEVIRKNRSITIYPNPIQNQFTIDIPDGIVGAEYRIEVKDMRGILVYSENRICNRKILVEISNLELGLYFLTINGKNLNHFQKIFVES